MQNQNHEELLEHGRGHRVLLRCRHVYHLYQQEQSEAYWASTWGLHDGFGTESISGGKIIFLGMHAQLCRKPSDITSNLFIESATYKTIAYRFQPS